MPRGCSPWSHGPSSSPTSREKSCPPARPPPLPWRRNTGGLPIAADLPGIAVGANCPQGACRRDGEGPKEQQSLSLASYQQGACCICLYLQISSCAVLCEAAVQGLLPIRLDLGRKRARPDKMPVFATAPSPPSSCVCFIPCPLVGSWTERLVSLRGRRR